VLNSPTCNLLRGISFHFSPPSMASLTFLITGLPFFITGLPRVPVASLNEIDQLRRCSNKPFTLRSASLRAASK